MPKIEVIIYPVGKARGACSCAAILHSSAIVLFVGATIKATEQNSRFSFSRLQRQIRPGLK